MRSIAFLAALFCSAVLAQDAGRAIFLVADPGMADPNFARTVILVARHEGVSGPFGVIINRQTEIPLGRAFAGLKGLEGNQDKLFAGGPIARSVYFYVYRSETKPTDAVQVVEGVYLGWDVDELRKLLARDKPTENLRVYAGHAGWAPGQLENEVASGAWKSARVDAASIFSLRPDTVWPEMIRRASATPVRWSPPGLDPARPG